MQLNRESPPEQSRFAFILHTPTLFIHYASVWAAMTPGSFTVVLYGQCEERRTDATRTAYERICARGYHVMDFSEVVRRRIRFPYVVSNHFIAGPSPDPAPLAGRLLRRLKNATKRVVNPLLARTGSGKRYFLQPIDAYQHPPKQLGDRQVRFMYGADISDGWSLGEWNRIYDAFLCHGPNDAEAIASRFDADVAIMGYPRYDGYFSDDLPWREVFTEFDLDPAKRTILWMPTADPFGDDVCSIPFFAAHIATLMQDYNVIVRPHPMSFRQEPEFIALLEEHGYRIDRDASRDVTCLFRAADYVLCDHGGSAFGALYLDKRLVFLKTPVKAGAKVAEGASNEALMNHFPAVDHQDFSPMRSLLGDDARWERRIAEARPLRDRFFADYRGNASEVAARLLETLDQRLERRR
ncbi:MAG: CDP-glycerol glycerophosphotransferase family protein [Deltaproteobacteria bacterium]|nr:CDP-glycerol glycerophosphotransferase family protein [Deltaproteobacteria bacterium]